MIAVWYSVFSPSILAKRLPLRTRLISDKSSWPANVLAKAEEDAAQKAFKLVQKKYSQGQANLVEWTNARTQMTTAEQRQNIAKYDYQTRLAEFERATGE